MGPFTSLKHYSLVDRMSTPQLPPVLLPRVGLDAPNSQNSLVLADALSQQPYATTVVSLSAPLASTPRQPNHAGNTTIEGFEVTC